MTKRSFRSAAAQATHIVQQLAAHGSSRHEAKHDSPGLIHSIATDHKTKSILSQYASWRSEQRLGPLHAGSREEALHWLTCKAEALQQNSLDGYRQALDKLLLVAAPQSERLPHLLAGKETLRSTRSYTPEQIRLIAAAQSERNSLATQIAHACGLRAHELLTIRPVAEQPASGHRTWREDRFMGRPGIVTHSVAGKGGLVREIAPLPPALLARLEACRLPEPRVVWDRGIRYEQRYDIGGGAKFSASFGAASKRVLGWSTGAHGLRHSYVQERMRELTTPGICGNGYTAKAAEQVVSQEIGHFRSLVSVYRR